MRSAIALTTIILLAACGTPQEQCINAATRDARVVDRLIREAEGNLARGYGYEYITVFETDYVRCGTEAEPRTCLIRRPEQERREVAIDLAAEARKLDQLRDKRRAQTLAAAPAIAQCKVVNQA